MLRLFIPMNLIVKNVVFIVAPISNPGYIEKISSNRISVSNWDSELDFYFYPLLIAV